VQETASVGLVGLGAMGSGIGRRLRQHDVEVVATAAGRSERSRARALDAGITLVDDLASMLAHVEVVLSIVPPAAARSVADDVAAAWQDLVAVPSPVGTTRRPPLVLDANAVAPATARDIAGTLAAAGLPAADGGIIGPPPRDEVTPRLYVSGDHLAVVLDLGRHGLDVRPVDGGVGAASALKLSFAALTKGTAALAIQLLVAAEAAGVRRPLLDELEASLPAQLAALERQLPGVPAKARRWVGEMEEIDAAFAAAGLPAGTFAAIADVYRWVGEDPLADPAHAPGDGGADLDVVVTALAELARRGTGVSDSGAGASDAGARDDGGGENGGDACSDTP
jgi:putative dehydrogenase